MDGHTTKSDRFDDVFDCDFVTARLKYCCKEQINDRLIRYSDGYLDNAEPECSNHSGRVGVEADLTEYHRGVGEHIWLTCQLHPATILSFSKSLTDLSFTDLNLYCI